MRLYYKRLKFKALIPAFKTKTLEVHNIAVAVVVLATVKKYTI